ncbi:MAG TPA: multicopper oxidase domain-containing protein [Edaphobacter sp.]|uniref:multicopper oxidase domain-containing protein n=1 Tax=Edaphobacter sp. TaxID=1934404 RepID=UPI002B947BC3|nr:multicopper oxidase domain-containing protein [Edaphobacter sp.]HUZ94635.1 multicopper oxidase domain-containing protein [Edaphobacter sp.]
MRNRWGLLPCTWAVIVLAAAAVWLPTAAAQTTQERAARGGKVRTYYVAADEVDWDYAPTGIDQMMGMPLEGMAKFFMEHGPHRIGRVYKKAIYREYTDATFTTLKPRPPSQQYLGILGPVLRAEVGDTIKVVFRNNGTHPYSMHPHGVFYEKASEGVAYNDGRSAKEEEGGHVEPGHTFTYTWEVPERAGPGPNDPSSIVWLYHSHANELMDVNSGLIGAIIVTRRGMALPDGRPKDVDKEFVTLFMMFDENQSWFIDENIRRHTDDPAGTKKSDATNMDWQGLYNFPLPGGFTGANLRFTINGMQYANLPMMTMKKGERVRWYVVAMGNAFNIHSPHWHGNVVMDHGSRTDVISVSPAQMSTVDMVPDDPGIWLYHCHMSDHMERGMVARYQVLP